MPKPLTDAPEELSDEALDRASERRSFFLNSMVTVEGHPTVQARVRNLSAGGMMIELENAPKHEWAPGDEVTADLRNIGEVTGEIAWAGGRRFGVRFDYPVDPELARQPVSTGKDVTPDYLKALRIPDRSLRKVGQATKR